MTAKTFSAVLCSPLRRVCNPSIDCNIRQSALFVYALKSPRPSSLRWQDTGVVIKVLSIEMPLKKRFCVCSFPHYVEEISSSRRPPSLHINRIDSERGSSIRYIVLLLLWLMAYSASNYSSNKEIDVGFSCLSAVSRDVNPAVRSNST